MLVLNTVRPNAVSFTLPNDQPELSTNARRVISTLKHQQLMASVAKTIQSSKEVRAKADKAISDSILARNSLAASMARAEVTMARAEVTLAKSKVLRAELN